MNLKIQDGRREKDMKRSMSNEVLLDTVKGLNDYLINTRGGYCETIFTVQIHRGRDVVGHGVLRLTSGPPVLAAFD